MVERMVYPREMRPRLKVWVEAEDGLVFSDYRVRLLQLVSETGSLSDAAERLGLSYRRAWGKLKEMQSNMGLKLVESVAGGSGGGHTRLTEAGADVVQRYARFRSRLEVLVEREFEDCFSEAGAPVTAQGKG